MSCGPGPWTTPYFQKKIVAVSVKVKLWTRYMYIKCRLPTIYAVKGFASNDGPAGICEVLAFSSWISLNIIFGTNHSTYSVLLLL